MFQIAIPFGCQNGDPGECSSKWKRSSCGPSRRWSSLLRLLEPLEVRVEVGLAEERGAVDPGQLRVLLVAAPVGAGEAGQLERLDRGRVLQVRAAAEVGEVALGPAEIHQAFGDLSARFDQIRQQKEVNLSVANSLWFERNYSFLPEFMDLSRKYYHVEAQPADFVGNSEAARLEINSWVEKKDQRQNQGSAEAGPGRRDDTSCAV